MNKIELKLSDYVALAELGFNWSNSIALIKQIVETNKFCGLNWTSSSECGYILKLLLEKLELTCGFN